MKSTPSALVGIAGNPAASEEVSARYKRRIASEQQRIKGLVIKRIEAARAREGVTGVRGGSLIRNHGLAGRRAREGWKNTFLVGIRDFPCVSWACRFANVSRKHAYISRAKDPAFAAAWHEAVMEGIGALEASFFRRAKDGDACVEFYPNGNIKQYRVTYPEKICIALLRAHLPHKYRDPVTTLRAPDKFVPLNELMNQDK